MSDWEYDRRCYCENFLWHNLDFFYGQCSDCRQSATRRECAEVIPILKKVEMPHGVIQIVCYYLDETDEGTLYRFEDMMWKYNNYILEKWNEPDWWYFTREIGEFQENKRRRLE